MELKECPHCGGEAFLYTNYAPKIGRYFVCIKCGSCGATGRASATKDDPEKYGFRLPACQMAASAWNMRTETEPEPITTEKAIRYLQYNDPETWHEITHGEF